jgi:phage terminase Nu1 subunit (DNA packaging protein)
LAIQEKLKVARLAKIYDVEPQTIYSWEKRGLFKRDEEGFIDLVEAVQAIYKHQRRLIRGRGSDELITQRTRIAKSIAEEKELKLRQLRGELLPAEDVKKETFELARATRDAIENIPGRISAILAAEASEHRVRELLAAELRQALQELSK